MKLGVFVAYSPGQLDPYQGIARLLGFIISGALDADNKVLIACPGWLRRDIAELLADAGIPADRVEILGTRGTPPIVQLWEMKRALAARRKPNAGVDARGTIDRLISKLAVVIVDWLSAGVLQLLVGTVALIVAGAVLFIPALILGALLAVAVVAWAAARRLVSSRIGRLLASGYRHFNAALSAPDIIDRVRAREVEKLVQIANRQEDIKVWYVPSMFWPEIAGLEAKKVVAAPDIVFYEHAAQYNSDGDRHTHERMMTSIQSADHLICYSEHVKHRHYVDANNIPAERVSVIRHGNVDLVKAGKAGLSRDEALAEVHNFLNSNSGRLPAYLNGFRFDDVDFIIYSSQYRPHKNLESLIRAFELVLRKHHRPIKLVLTAKLDHYRLRRLIEERGLQADVLSLHSIPNVTLAALYHLARVSVTPTMFEGGFPFTFSEAYSVGTPSLMSRIPVVREVISDPELFEAMTFEPLDVDGLAEKIIWALDNRDALFAAQTSLYQKFRDRPWSKVAGEYLAVIRDVESRGHNAQ